MPTLNHTHRKRLARAYAKVHHVPYMTALAKVRDAADAGVLPARLDEEGMSAALTVLTLATTRATTGGEGQPRRASNPADQPIWDLSHRYTNMTGNDALLYIESPGGPSESDRYVFGGPDHTTCLGRRAAHTHVANLVSEATLAAAANTYADALTSTTGTGTGAEGLRADRQESDLPTNRWFVDIPKKWSSKQSEHPMWRRPVPEYAGRLVAIDTEGDQYAAQAAASLVLGDDGWGGISSTSEMGPRPDEVFARLIDHKHTVVGLHGHVEDCLGCTNDFLAIWGYQVGQGVVCKPCVADLHSECAGRRNNNRGEGRDSGMKICNCECRDLAATDQFHDGLPEGAGVVANQETDPGDEVETPAPSAAIVWRVAHEGNSVERCVASSWRDKPSKRDPEGYGPGGFNRCVKAAGHTDIHHLDEWGHLFRLTPTATGTSFKVLSMVSAEEMASIAREAGMHVSDGSDIASAPPALPRPNTLWVTSGKGARAEIVKVSTVYPDEDRVTAQVVIPVPPRTTVRSYPSAETRAWRQPTDAEVRRYDQAWGL